MKTVIRNFKSIRHIELDAKRINIIIGEPNVGKSNVLEALSLLGEESYRTSVLGELSIRYNAMAQLYHKRQLAEPIFIRHDEARLGILYEFDQNKHTLVYGNDKGLDRQLRDEAPESYKDTQSYLGYVDARGSGGYSNTPGRTSLRIARPVRKYVFINAELKGDIYSVLIAPHGENLFSTIYHHTELSEAVVEMLAHHDLQLVLEQEERTLKVQYVEDNGLVIQLPYHLIADTLQRAIFYTAAIYSNRNATLLFEEPENHSFPGYVKDFAHKVIDDENGNTFFIATHSPYFLETILESADYDDVTISVAYQQAHETRLRQLTNSELEEIHDYGTDLFFNLSRYYDTESAAA